MSTPLKWPGAQVHWHEGQFLLPHHFQLLERGLRHQLLAERSLAWPYPYGVVDASLAEGSLANRSLQFKSLHVVMPSGLEVCLGKNIELEPLSFDEQFKQLGGEQSGLQVTLGVPHWTAIGANTADADSGADRRARRLYRLVEEEVPDENTGTYQRPVQLRLVNARLLLTSAGPPAVDPDLETLPLFRILRATGNGAGAPSLDPKFAPPCLVLRGSKILFELVDDLAQQVSAAHKDLLEQVKRVGFNPDIIHWPELKNILRMRTLGHYSARLAAWVRSPAVTPFAIYLEFCSLLGELTALEPDQEEASVPEFNHRNPWLGFEELCRRIQPLLHDVVLKRVLRAPFAQIDGMLRASLAPDHLVAGASYYLGIQTTLEPTSLAEQVTDGDRFKIMPPSRALDVVRGVALHHRPFVSFLPTQAGLHYFQLEPAANDHSGEMWTKIVSETAAVISGLGDDAAWAGSTFTLFITLPTTPSPA